ncbi:MAG: response regulator [Betaproteobacteria bacterium]|nr:response regulator [Betaproteobacteria bacterium]
MADEAAAPMIGAGLRALVIDDDETMSDFVSSVLSRAGYAVTVCGDGMAGLNAFRAAPFDVVVADERMPRLSGLSFLRNLRLPQGSKHRVVMFTSMADQKFRREAQAAGAFACLNKPASAQALLDAIAGKSPGI